MNQEKGAGKGGMAWFNERSHASKGMLDALNSIDMVLRCDGVHEGMHPKSSLLIKARG